LLAALVALATFPLQAPAQQPPGRGKPQSYLGRTIAPTMHFSGAGWLTRGTREQEERPSLLLEALEIRPGQVLCDFGCGNGYHTLDLAKRTGPRGRVLAVDIQPEMLDMLADRAAARGIDNIRRVLATQTNSGLVPRTLDLVLMVDVYHELAEPPQILQAVHAALKPTGRVAVVEFREEDPEVPILPLHKMNQSQVVKEFTANRFKLVGQYDQLPWQHVLFFARGDAPLAEHPLKLWQPPATR
jgi:precorrin-6B methylase 2